MDQSIGHRPHRAERFPRRESRRDPEVLCGRGEEPEVLESVKIDDTVEFGGEGDDDIEFDDVDGSDDDDDIEGI